MDKFAMEERLQVAIEKQKIEEMKLASEIMAPRSRIATPGLRTGSMRREPGTPQIRRGVGL